MTLRGANAPWKTISGIVVVIACVAVITTCFFSLRSRQSTAPVQPPGAETEHARKPQSPGQIASAVSVRSTLEGALRDLRSASDPTQARIRFDELRRFLQTLPADATSSVIRDFLDSKADAASRLPFRVGANGFLMESPSLRVFLLDYLAQTDPAAAAAYATTILATMDSSDEWAVALRNYAKVNRTPEARTFLALKLQEMLTHEPWVQNPALGFLEAFDVAVYLGSTDLIPTLAGMVRMEENLAVAHAAYLALDRLSIADTAATLSVMQANPELMQGREETRANYFARADVRDLAQRRLVEDYLLNPAIAAVELEKFAGLYPNANFMVSHNLLTQTETPSHGWLAGRDAEALRVTREWLGDPRFSDIKPQLERIQQRLGRFVLQANPAQ